MRLGLIGPRARADGGGGGGLGRAAVSEPPPAIAHSRPHPHPHPHPPTPGPSPVRTRPHLRRRRTRLPWRRRQRQQPGAAGGARLKSAPYGHRDVVGPGHGPGRADTSTAVRAGRTRIRPVPSSGRMPRFWLNPSRSLFPSRSLIRRSLKPGRSLIPSPSPMPGRSFMDADSESFTCTVDPEPCADSESLTDADGVQGRADPVQENPAPPGRRLKLQILRRTRTDAPGQVRSLQRQNATLGIDALNHASLSSMGNLFELIAGRQNVLHRSAGGYL